MIGNIVKTLNFNCLFLNSIDSTINTLVCLICVGYHLELYVDITFY